MAAELPHSKITDSILVVQVSLNQQFPKSYASPNASKKPPVEELTLSACAAIIIHSLYVRLAILASKCGRKRDS